MAVSTADIERDIASLVIGTSPSVQRLRAMIARVAASDVSVLLAGPSGSGKELVAQAIHAASSRSTNPALAVSLLVAGITAITTGAIPAELIESELFGHEKGSFTGAHSRRTGHFENAHKGTLFLDEIGDMRFDMQVKLLRVLEERVVTRVGSSVCTPVDVRIVSATHRDMDSAMAEGRFRQAVRRSPSTSASSPRPAATSSAICKKAASGRIYSSGSASCFCTCRHWPKGVRIFRSSSVISRRANPPAPSRILTKAHLSG